MIKKHKRFLPILIILVIIIGFILYSGKVNINQNSPVGQLDSQPSISPLPNAPQPLFAIYPGAKLDKVTDVVYYSKDSYSYNYRSNDSFDKVVKWYEPINYTTGEANPQTNGWVLSGGAGSSGQNRYGTFRKGDMRYQMVINNFQSYTEIQVIIPK